MRLENLGRFYILGIRAPKTVFLCGVLVAAIALMAAGRLRVGDFFAEMLPEGTRSVENLEQCKRDFGELGHLVIAIEARDPLLARQYASDFTERIRVLPDVYYVRFRQPLEYFTARKWLFVDLPDLIRMEARIDRALDLEKQGISAVFSGFMDFADEENRPDLTFSDIQKKYESAIGPHLNEYSMSADGRTIVLSVKARRAFQSLADKQRFIDAIRSIERELRRYPSYQAVTVGYTGSYQTAIEALNHTKREILLISILVFPILFLILLVYFKRLDALIFLGLPLLVGVIYTGGITYLLFGRLNLLTSFASGILAGLGSDYGIYLLSRYYQEREMGQDCESALHFAFRNTGTATFLSLLTSVIAFSGLLFSNFSVLIEFGAVGAIGLVMNYIALMLMIPSLIILEERWQIRAWFRVLDRWNHLGQSHVFSHARWFSRFYNTGKPRAVIAVAIFVTFLSALTLPVQSKIEFESEGMNRLDIPSNRLYDRVSTMIGASLNPTVLMTDSLEEDRRTVDTLHALLETEAPGQLVFNHVIGLSRLIPLDQDKKKEVITRIKEKYGRLHVAKGKSERSFIDSLKTTLTAEPISIETLPDEVKRLFTSPHDREKFAAYLFPAFARTGSDAMKRYQENIIQLRQDHHLKFLPVDGSFLAADALREMETKAPRGIMYIFLFFALILFVVLRPWDRAAMILFNLVGGMILLSGILWLCELKLTILNIVAIPIILGTGIDCFLHFNGQYSEDHTVDTAMKKQVNPILMSSLTSMIGFAGLMLTSNPSLRSLGWVAVIGLLLMAVLAIFVFSRCLALEALWKKRVTGRITI